MPNEVLALLVPHLRGSSEQTFVETDAGIVVQDRVDSLPEDVKLCLLNIIQSSLFCIIWTKIDFRETRNNLEIS